MPYNAFLIFQFLSFAVSLGLEVLTSINIKDLPLFGSLKKDLGM